MFRCLMPLMAATSVVAVTAAPAFAAEVQIATQGPVVELSVNEIVYSAPDMAQVGAGVVTRAATAQEAARQNAAAMERIVERIRSLGIDERDIQTSNFSLNPQYQYNQQTGEQTFTGYHANNQVNVKLRDMTRIGEVLDALIAAGANNIYGPNFSLENDAEAKAAARTAAFRNGREMAQEYARMAGYSGLRLLEVSESFQHVGPPMPVMARMESADASAKTPIVPGEVGTGVTLTVKYEMTR